MHATYTYDANGQRTRSVVRSGGTTTTTDWTYEGLTLLSVKAESTGSTTASWTIDYLYDGSGRPYAGVYRSGAEAAASFTFVTTDRGDVVGLLDKSGVGFAAYRYDAWGKSTSVTSQGTARIGTSAASEIAIRQPQYATRATHESRRSARCAMWAIATMRRVGSTTSRLGTTTP